MTKSKQVSILETSRYTFNSRPFSYVNGLSWLPGRIVSSVDIGNLSPNDLDEIQETKP